MWKDSGSSYYLHVTKPNTYPFYYGRKGSISPSKFYTCIGEDPDITQEHQVKLMTGEIKQTVTDQQRINMDRGIKHEPIILNVYKEEHPDYDIRKFSDNEYPVWKKDTYIRGIPDSVVYSSGKIVGIVEAKSKFRFNGEINNRDKYQILGYMAIFEAEWCDFCVYCIEEDKYYIIRYNFNQEEWDELYGKLKDFKERLLIPALKNKKFPIQPEW